jgi:hypothetical protein
MGLMRFFVHDRDRIPPGGLEHVHMCGQEDLPWFARVYFSGDNLVIERNEDESGRVFVPWRIGDASPILVGTATLMERDTPYVLEVELARGMVNTLRNQIAQWESMGLVVPQSLRSQVLEATSDFSRAATMQNDLPAAAEWAGRSLATCVLAMDHLAAEYAQQALQARRSQAKSNTTWYGVRLGNERPSSKTSRQLAGTFNMVSLPVSWRSTEAVEGRRIWDHVDAQVDWAHNAGLRISAGPILELDDTGVPDWTYLWEGDFDNLLSFMLEHVRAVVERYRGKVHLWQVASRMTHGHALGLSEEARLQVVAKAITTVRKLDPTTPLVVSFDQPWAEYLANQHLDLAPLHFADALVRADLGLSGVGLEINVGYHPGGSFHRGPLALSRLIDTWSLLELPLLVALALPSSSAEDPQANPKIRVLQGDSDSINPDSQRDWIDRHLPMLLAKNAVQVVVWNQLTDSAPHHYPHAGLFDADNKPKPSLDALKKIRQKYINSGK